MLSIFLRKIIATWQQGVDKVHVSNNFQLQIYEMTIQEWPAQNFAMVGEYFSNIKKLQLPLTLCNVKLDTCEKFQRMVSKTRI